MGPAYLEREVLLDRIEAIHPDPAKHGVRIERWKYDAVRRTQGEVARVKGAKPQRLLRISSR
jgi:hypothetical protein